MLKFTNILKYDLMLFFSHNRFFKMNHNFIKTVTSKEDNAFQTDLKYKEAVCALNELQSNAAVINEVKQKGKLIDLYKHRTELDIKYCLRSGLNFDQLDTLSVIHITGTKGKGSTSAFCESILRRYGYKTGFFSSPHLVCVRERIRLNGKPIEKADFVKYFWLVYNKLYENKENETDMPAYFRFLTIMAFHVFYHENVDVAIVEVGIGGEYDCTNILRNVPVVGITSLGLDHTTLLGNTLAEIAWQKGGILKSNCQAFTVKQPEEALQVLKSRSIDKKCSLEVCPNLEEYEFDSLDRLSIFNVPDVQKINIALAIRLSYAWLKKDYRQKICKKTVEGILNCRWPGRMQILDTSIAKFYLDGAHTLDSIIACLNWFKTNNNNMNDKKILLFNITGERDALPILKILKKFSFDMIFFTPNIAYTNEETSDDQKNFNNPENLQLQRCEDHRKMWNNICDESQSVNNSLVNVFPSVSHALKIIQLDNNHPSVLVTGSLHLVGAVLKLLDPDLKISES